MRFSCKLNPVINAWTGNKKEITRDCWFPVFRVFLSKQHVPFSPQMLWPHERPWTSETKRLNKFSDNIYFGSSSVGSNRTTISFQAMGVSYSRNKEECPLYVEVRHWHTPVFVLRLGLENEMRNSAVACDKGVKETSSNQLPTTWMKKESKFCRRKCRKRKISLLLNKPGSCLWVNNLSEHS